jgi:tetratricopeptide (TPR) repeat protein
VTVDQMRECLVPMSQIDVTAPEYVRLTSEAEKLEKERQVKEAETKTAESEVKQLAELFQSAEKIQNEGYAFKAIKQYKKVIDSPLLDPKKLKELAQKRIAFIEEKVAEKSVKGISQADALFQEGKLKAAVNLLRESQIYDPENRKIKDKIDYFSQELRRQTRSLYQEAIIDESYGIVDSTETKQGAKDKWKRITEIDLDDGEYYKKAVIKLRRYGVL